MSRPVAVGRVHLVRVALLAGLSIEAFEFLEVVGRELRGRRGLAGGLVGVAVVLVIGAGAVGLRCGLLLDRGLAAELVRAQFQVAGDQVADLVTGAERKGMDQPLDLGLVVGQGGDLVLQL